MVLGRQTETVFVPKMEWVWLHGKDLNVFDVKYL
jgi:hypothetical protein